MTKEELIIKIQAGIKACDEIEKDVTFDEEEKWFNRGYKRALENKLEDLYNLE